MLCNSWRKRSKQDVQSSKALVICLEMHKDAEAAMHDRHMPVVDLFSVKFKGRCTAAPQFTRAGLALLRAL
jgi:hypothetical protein